MQMQLYQPDLNSGIFFKMSYILKAGDGTFTSEFVK